MVEVKDRYNSMCLDLNMDDETRELAWKNYENVRRSYLIEGDQLHWLSISLYICCSMNESRLNPISIDRLLKCSKEFSLKEFFSKIHQWSNMINLNEEKRKKFDQVEKSFSISSTIYQKYPRMFSLIFGGNEEKYLRLDFDKQRKMSQLNRKFRGNKDKQMKNEEIYSLGWTIFALAKTIYPSTFFDLSASFYLLISSIEYLSNLQSSMNEDENSLGDHQMISILCREYQFDEDICLAIYDEHFLGETFWKNLLKKSRRNEENFDSTRFDRDDRLREFSREINRYYDEIVLTNCFLDERIFLKQSKDFYDEFSSLNENRSQIHPENKTPLTAHQHFLSSSSSTPIQTKPLTPISQTKHLIEQFQSLIQSNSNSNEIDPLKFLRDLSIDQIYFDHFNELFNEWKKIYDEQYECQQVHRSLFQREKSSKNHSERYFQLALKFFYRTFENIISIEEKKQNSTENLVESIRKLLMNNEFLKSLFCLSLLLVFFVHGDEKHNYQWIFDIYSIHSYSFLKIIQIFLKTRKDLHRIRSLIKYLSKIEEIILSSLVWKSNSTFWIEFHKKGFVSFQQVFSSSKSSIQCPTPQTNLHLFSPSIHQENVSRKLFHSNSNPKTNENLDEIKMKSSPYTMFFRKLYQLVLYRIDLLLKRIVGNEKSSYEKFILNLFEFLLKNYFEILFSQRDLDQIILSMIFFSFEHSNKFIKDSNSIHWIKLIQIYKTMPNSRSQILRSVFLYPEDQQILSFKTNEISSNEQCLTPSKPAGTKTLIDGFYFGDIINFYEEIFLHLKEFPENFFRSIE